LRHVIGYVPQNDLVHAELTCRQALDYVGRLRLPALANAERARLSARVFIGVCFHP
jgi:ABC-type multidrug transport system ATPase subunit